MGKERRIEGGRRRYSAREGEGDIVGREGEEDKGWEKEIDCEGEGEGDIVGREGEEDRW